MGNTEVPGHDRSIDGGHDLCERDLFGLACEHIATTDPSLRADQASSLERQQDLFEIGLRQRRALGDVAHRRWCLCCPVQCQ